MEYIQALYERVVGVQGREDGGREGVGGWDPRAVDLDTYVSTRVFKTVPWNDV